MSAIVLFCQSANDQNASVHTHLVHVSRPDPRRYYAGDGNIVGNSKCGPQRKSLSSANKTYLPLSIYCRPHLGAFDMDYFKSIPWCSTFLTRPDIVPYTPTCRLEPDASGHLPTQDQFFRIHLRNTKLIPNCIGFYHDPFSNHRPEEKEENGLRLLIPSSTLLLDLHPGVNGFNGSAHGGLISTLIDEAMGSLIFINDVVYKQVQSRGRPLPSNALNMNGVAMFTASMNVRFRRPLETPQVVMATATVNKIEGRKIFLDVDVRSRDGVVFATCDGMWMSVPKVKL